MTEVIYINPVPLPDLECYTTEDLEQELEARKIANEKALNTLFYYTEEASGCLCGKLDTKELADEVGCPLGSYWVFNGDWELRPTGKKDEYEIVLPEDMKAYRDEKGNIKTYEPDKFIIHWEKIKLKDILKDERFKGYLDYLPYIHE